MKEPKKITVSFNPDAEGIYILISIDGEYYKKYLTEKEHGNILQRCMQSYFEKKSIALLNDAVKVDKESKKLLDKAQEFLEYDVLS